MERKPGFRSLNQEDEIETELDVEGEIPEWTTGSLVRNGPAKFEVGDRKLRHWFDGLAMLHVFDVDSGEVIYKNRFLRSEAYESASSGEMKYGEFATDPCRDIFKRFFTFFKGREATDNANVNVTKLGEKFVAMTETPMPVEFDPETLDTLGVVEYEDDLESVMTTAHPHKDFEKDVVVNYVTEMGRKSRYKVYELDEENFERQPMGSFEIDRPAYMHSFGMTDENVILAEYPFVVNPLRLRFGNRPFIENYEWKPENSTRFILINRDSGEVSSRFTTEPFFSFHHVNAFERGDQTVVDLIKYSDASIIEDFYLDNLDSDTVSTEDGLLTRYILDHSSGEVETETLYDESIELPRINYREHNARDYRYVYSVTQVEDFIDGLAKIDVKQREARMWTEENAHPGEPVFIPHPEEEGEDSGVVMSVVLNSVEEKSFLLVLDAESFEELGRAEVPHPIPHGFHGQFYNER